MKRAAAAMVVLVIAGLLGWKVYSKLKARSAGNDGRKGGAALAVETAPVAAATVRDAGLFTGTLKARSLFVVAPKIAGRLEKLTVDVGDVVQRGQLIAELDDEEYAQQVEQARAELAVASAGVAECRSTLEMAQRDLARATALHEKKVASDSELDAARANEVAAVAKQNVALSEVTRREAALKAAEVRLSYTRIHAAWGEGDGARIVGERYVDEGEMLTANKPLVSVLDNSIMKAQIDIIERDYSKIRVGQQAVLATDAFPGREFSGTIARISPMLKESSRQARVEIEVANADGALKPGMFVRATIEFDRHENALVVPVSALVSREGRQGVFSVEAGDGGGTKARFVPVKLGIVEQVVAEVLEPRLSGRVVTLGQHLLEDGAEITLPEAVPGGAEDGNRGVGKSEGGRR